MSESMSEQLYPDALTPVSVPALYSFPPRPLAAIGWIVNGLLFPWGMFFIAMAVLAWFYFSPALAVMSEWSVGWVAQLWLRNALMLSMVAGPLYWWLYVRRGQGERLKIDPRWPRDSKQFLGGRQLTDNIVYSLLWGVSFWTAYEAATLWYYASGGIAVVTWSEAPLYLSLMCVGVFFWSTFHFYFTHRFLHGKWIFRQTHALHHRNINPTPWSGISNHPYEHVVYFSVFLLWWIVPVHPVIIALTGIYQGISPAISHCGFRRIELGKLGSVAGGDLFHHLHHQNFEVNYGNTTVPLDVLAGTWHDGSAEAHAALRERREARRQQMRGD